MTLLALIFLVLAIIAVNQGVLPGFGTTENFADSSNIQVGGFHGHRIWEKRHQRKVGLNHPYRDHKYRRGYHHPYHHFWKYRATNPKMAHYVDLNDPPYNLANWYSWDSLRRQGIQGTPWWVHYYHYYD